MEKKILTLNSELDSLNILEKFIEEVCDFYHINDTYFGNILVAMNEAFENAMIHGNRKDQNKKVVIDFEARPEGICFTIKDEGEGFDYEKISDPTLEHTDENLGRGVYLMRALSDQIEFSANGTEVEMLFKISSLEKETSMKRVNELKQYFGHTAKTTAGNSL